MKLKMITNVSLMPTYLLSMGRFAPPPSSFYTGLTRSVWSPSLSLSLLYILTLGVDMTSAHRQYYIWG